MNDAVNPLALVARILLSSIFVVSGAGKLSAIAATSAHMASAGIPYASDLVWGAVALELGGGIFLIFGLLTRLIGLAFFFYTLVLAVMFHAYWTLTGAAAHAQHTAFFEHLTIMGGMLYVVVSGPGAYSVDALLWRRRPALQPAE